MAHGAMLRSLRQQQQAAAASQRSSDGEGPEFSWAELPDGVGGDDGAEAAAARTATWGRCRVCTAEHSTKACPLLHVTPPPESLPKVWPLCVTAIDKTERGGV